MCWGSIATDELRWAARQANPIIPDWDARSSLSLETGGPSSAGLPRVTPSAFLVGLGTRAVRAILVQPSALFPPPWSCTALDGGFLLAGMHICTFLVSGGRVHPLPEWIVLKKNNGQCVFYADSKRSTSTDPNIPNHTHCLRLQTPFSLEFTLSCQHVCSLPITRELLSWCRLGDLCTLPLQCC